METKKLDPHKANKFRQFINATLEDDITTLKGWPLKETSINFGIGILMFFMAALHLVVAATQLAFSLIATACDLLVKALVKIMPAPKIKEVTQ